MNIYRLLRFKWLKLIRIADSNYRIAAGLATGAAVSFSPFLGTHMVQAAGLSYVLRFNVIASLVGTIFGNPWTFPFIWFLSAELGSSIFKLLGLPASVQLPDALSLSVLWEIIKTNPLQLFLPWMVGGYLLALITWFPIYFASLHFVRTARAARRKAIALKRKRKAARE
jgi:hypothetical protein